MTLETVVHFNLDGVCKNKIIKYTSYEDKHESLKSLHQNFNRHFKDHKILDVSEDSNDSLGMALSRDYLRDKEGRLVSHIFEGGRLCIEGGKITGLKIEDKLFPAKPWTLTKYWFWFNAVYHQKELLERVLEYDAFSDINMLTAKRTFGLPAEAAALMVTVNRLGYLDAVMEDIESFAKGCYGLKL